MCGGQIYNYLVSNNKKLSNILVSYSCDVKKGERVLISYEGSETKPLVKEIIREVHKKGGLPFIEIRDSEITRELILKGSDEQFSLINKHSLTQMKSMDAFIAIRGGNNINELSDVPSPKLNNYFKRTRPTTDYRVNNTKWVVLRYPNYSMAQLAEMSFEQFNEFYYKVCTLDYKKMNTAMDSLKKMMDKTNVVRIKGKGTNLTFSIKGIPSIKCAGERNIPDGEIYTAPIINSMNGHITYNTPSVENGYTFENIYFEIKNGQIINATSNNTKKLNEILDTDKGSRFFGEFALGINPHILKPMKDTLFDEKIAGSFHLTPGMCYEDASNSNKSAIHWDLVSIQRKEFGGGEIYFDNVLVRRNGIFVHPNLKKLNRENLI